MFLPGSYFLDGVFRSEAQLNERHSLRPVRARTESESLVQVVNSEWDEIAGAFEPNLSFPTDLHFAVARDTDTLSPLFGAIPQKLVRANYLLSMADEAHIRFHRKRWQFENIGFRYSVLQASDRFLLIDCVRCVETLSKRNYQDEEIDAALHRRIIKQHRKGSERNGDRSLLRLREPKWWVSQVHTAISTANSASSAECKLNLSEQIANESEA
jgi:hypothetical protein